MKNKKKKKSKSKKPNTKTNKKPTRRKSQTFFNQIINLIKKKIITINFKRKLVQVLHSADTKLSLSVQKYKHSSLLSIN